MAKCKNCFGLGYLNSEPYVKCHICDGHGFMPAIPVYYKILDKDGVEMPDDWATTPRTYDKVKNLLDRLNINGPNRPYTMVEK